MWMKNTLCLLLMVVWVIAAQAGIEGSVSGVITDPQGIAVPNAPVKILSQNKVVNETTASSTGEFHFFPVTFGDYHIVIEKSGFAPSDTAVHVSSGGDSHLEIQLQAKESKEMVLEVKAKKHLIQKSAAVSSTEINQDQIKNQPQGNDISLPKLISTNSPGVVPGPFGQMFFRGNHANIQYQIDGIQLPDSSSNTFGQAFAPRNIDHMEIITGGIPAEYGERLAAVVNIVTKSGPETPGGEAEINYGSYNTFSPFAIYGGSNPSGDIHYFVSANYNNTDRGLDTPQPKSESNQKQGGTDAIHDKSNGNNEFAKIDWLPDNNNKFSLIFFNAETFYQIPNYPSSFKSTDSFFQAGFSDQFGNGGDPSATTFNFVPSNTDDTQTETNAYIQTIWKHTFNEKSFLQVAPYYKYSKIEVTNDPANDLASFSPGGSQAIVGSSPSSFAENRHVDNMGVKADYTLRPDDKNLIKTGLQFQYSHAAGSFSLQTDPSAAPFVDSSPDTGIFESVYAQDDYTISKKWILNAGLRFDATQFYFSGVYPKDSLLQPRIGLNYMVTETTKLHLFYGKLFQPAPVENLRDTYVNGGGGGQPAPYDIKAEKDDYYEMGIDQQLNDQQLLSVNVYYKDATNMLDDAQLLNTSIAQPYNFAKGYAYGAELSLRGQIDNNWAEHLNYSYEIAKGKGISGGIFAFPVGTSSGGDYQFLDHVQVQTANAGLTYTKNNLWWTTDLLYGSGLRTGPDNSASLPSHFTMDTTVGYEFLGDEWYTRFKLSGDILNIFDNVYPITVANGFNGSHYAAGREFFVRVSKAF